MNKSRFDEIVKNRANARVQKRAEQFKVEFGEAVQRLWRKFPAGYSVALMLDPRNGTKDAANNQVLLDWLTGKSKTLPAEIWAEEEDAVQAELLATMDEMQKALCAPAPSPDGVQPSPPPAP